MQKQSLKMVLTLALLVIPMAAYAFDIPPVDPSTRTPVLEPITAVSPPHACLNYTDINFAEQQLPLARFKNNQLSTACFYRTNLTEADFRGAALISADLREATLMGADLRRANLSSARLEGANLRGATVRNAVFSGATYDEFTQFPTGFVPQQWGMVQVSSTCP